MPGTSTPTAPVRPAMKPKAIRKLVCDWLYWMRRGYGLRFSWRLARKTL